MVTKEQFKNGLLAYIDAEVMPNLPSYGKWIAGTAIVLATANYERYFSQFSCNKSIQSFGIINQNCDIDVDKLANALKASADKYGDLKLSFPVLGTLYFSSDDVDKAKRFIVEGAYE